MNNQLEIVKCLLEREDKYRGYNVGYNNNANVNLKAFGGTTALMAAATKGHLDIVVYLVKKEAKCDILNDVSNETE